MAEHHASTRWSCGSGPYGCGVPPRHRLVDRDHISLSSLAADNFVAMRREYGLRDLLETACRRAGFEPSVTVETGQISVLWGMVSSGLGVSVLPRLAAGAYGPTVPLADDGAIRELAVVWRSRSDLSPPATSFLDMLCAAARFSPGRR